MYFFAFIEYSFLQIQLLSCPWDLLQQNCIHIFCSWSCQTHCIMPILHYLYFYNITSTPQIKTNTDNLLSHCWVLQQLTDWPEEFLISSETTIKWCSYKKKSPDKQKKKYNNCTAWKKSSCSKYIFKMKIFKKE